MGGLIMKSKYPSALAAALLLLIPAAGDTGGRPSGRLLLSASLNAVATAADIRAGTFKAFGETYRRTEGEPRLVRANFAVLNPQTFYTLRAYPLGSGTATDKKPDGKGPNPPKPWVTATIRLNGFQVVDPDDFHRKTEIEKRVELRRENRIEVKLRGTPGAQLRVEIIGIDRDAPTITATASPAANAQGWNQSAVTVRFRCKDKTSGMAFCPEPVVVSSEGSNQTVTGTARDKAGHTASASVIVNLDLTPPAITASVSPLPNSASWNNSDTSVTFACADSLSGIASCSAPVLVTTEGANQPVLGDARDMAGNIATASVSISLDKTPPSLAVTEPAPGGTVDHSPVTILGTATDAHSGIAEVTCAGSPAGFSAGSFNCDVTVSDGSNAIPIEAKDLAGNVGTTTAQFVGDTAELELMYIDRFQSVLLWSSVHNGYEYYRPEALPPALRQFYFLGDSGPIPGISPSFAMVARELKPPRTVGGGPVGGALAAPMGYDRAPLQRVWNWNTGDVWKPIPPPGYVCLGVLVTDAFDAAPGTDDMRCVRQDLTSGGKVGVMMGRHECQVTTAWCTSWQLVPADADGIYTGQFAWSDADQPPSEPLYTIRAQAVRALRPSSAEIVNWIETYGPVIRLHPDEQYLPDDPEYVLNGSSLQWGLVPTESDYSSFSLQLLGQVATSPANLMGDVAVAQSDPQAGDSSFRTWLGVPDAMKPGDTSRTRVLVQARTWNTIFTEIQFWIYYPFNGPGKFIVTCGSLLDTYREMTYPGRHYGDWEHVSLLIGPRGSLVSLYLSRHDLNVWVTQKDFGSLGWQGLHPVIYAARDSHAHYTVGIPGPMSSLPYKRVKHSDYGVCTLDVDLVDWTGDGATLDAFDPQIYRFVSSTIPGVNPSEPEPEWLQFAGRWGQYLTQSESFYFHFFGVYTYTYTFEEVGAGPSGPAMKTAWKKGDWCLFSGTCQ
jgi:hypothetical protein